MSYPKSAMMTMIMESGRLLQGKRKRRHLTLSEPWMLHDAVYSGPLAGVQGE